ncbi:MAG: beta-N-acetylglucosaminidase domain-containing protein, partial [Bacteroidaceae bacterium]|nr:beta-N-acetylglucosaminidase domain-containing protein [Bacteroidaceae bacterium]
MALAASTAADAQKVTVSPLPQEISWGSEKAFDKSVAFKVKGLKSADADAVALLQKNFNLDGKKIKLIIGERGDKAVKKYNSLIPQKSEGYYLSIGPEEVVIAGNDERGTYYGTQTFLQIASADEVMCVTVSDYPDVATRGMVEGYYGNPYSEEDRKSMFEFFGKQKMNTYIYGPKDDIYHRAKWREEYPAAEAAKIAEYAKVAKANKVDFVWAIHPGNDIKWNRTDSLNMIKKLNAMYELGIRTYAVFFDDIWGEGTDATRQAGLLNYISDEFVKKHDDVAPLILCPTQYNKGWSSGNYLDILGEKSYKETNIMWTGNSVIDMINKKDMEWINNRIKRNAYIWLNYPVNDYCVDHMLMGPTYG